MIDKGKDKVKDKDKTKIKTKIKIKKVDLPDSPVPRRRIL